MKVVVWYKPEEFRVDYDLENVVGRISGTGAVPNDRWPWRGVQMIFHDEDKAKEVANALHRSFTPGVTVAIRR